MVLLDYISFSLLNLLSRLFDFRESHRGREGGEVKRRYKKRLFVMMLSDNYSETTVINRPPEVLILKISPTDTPVKSALKLPSEFAI